MQPGSNNARARRGLVATVARFLRGRRGVVSPILALALIPIVAGMGVGVEASNWWLTQRSAQNAADSAVIAAAVDAGANYAVNSNSFTSTVPTVTACTSATTSATSWYCQAKAAAAKLNFVDGSSNVTVTPTYTSCPAGVTKVTGGQCYKVTVQKYVPLYLLNLIGYSGTTTIGGSKYQSVVATAYAGPSGPPVDFCMLTTNGDFQTNGSASANLLGCSTFANGNSNCNGHGDGIAYDYASGTASCPSPDVNVPVTYQQCDPYGATVQTIQSKVTQCPASTNVSASIPSNTSCTNSNANTATNGDGKSTMPFPAGNIITQAMINAAVTANPTNPVVQVCGNAAFGAGTVVNTLKSGKYTPAVAPCTSTINYSTAANIQIVVYNGSLDLNGCTLETTAGGMTLEFAPNYTASGAVNGVCANVCVPLDKNSIPGVIDIAAPESGNFKGLAIMQSANFTNGGTGGGCTGGSGGGPLDWCAAGNSPTLKIQGGIYMPLANLGFAGAISKFDGVAGALNCIGIISKSMYVNGTGALFNNFTAGLTSQCSTAGFNIPSIPGSHLYYQALVG